MSAKKENAIKVELLSLINKYAKKWNVPAEEAESMLHRKLDDAFWWVKRNYGGKKVKLNPMSILKYNQTLAVPHNEYIIVVALRKAETDLRLKFDWLKYEHYKRIMGKVGNKRGK